MSTARSVLVVTGCCPYGDGVCGVCGGVSVCGVKLWGGVACPEVMRAEFGGVYACAVCCSIDLLTSPAVTRVDEGGVYAWRGPAGMTDVVTVVPGAAQPGMAVGTPW